MSYETISLLLHWMEMGALLAILFRLSATFDLIANTQRELRRAIHHLGERRATNNEPTMESVSRFPNVRVSTETKMGRDDFASQSP